MSRVCSLSPVDAHIIHSNFRPAEQKIKFRTTLSNTRTISDVLFNADKKRKREESAEQCKKMKMDTNIADYPFHGRPMLYVQVNSFEERRKYLAVLEGHMDRLLPPVIVRPESISDVELEKAELFAEHVKKLLAICDEFLPAALVRCETCSMPNNTLPAGSVVCRTCKRSYCTICVEANREILKKRAGAQSHDDLLCSYCFEELPPY